MQFKYRVKGKVEQAFILRGRYNGVGTDIDLLLFGNELEFVKERCGNVVVTDLDNEPKKIDSKPVSSPESVLEEQKVENKPKGAKNELQSEKRTSNASKGKHKANI